MCEYRQGNILEAQAEALVNAVNCLGVMGKGVALQFKNLFPQNFKQYQQACRGGKVKPGEMFIVPLESAANPNLKYIVNFPTKQHWRNNSNLDFVKTGLAALIKDIERLEIRSIAVPALGCGNGGLRWPIVEPLILDAFEQIPQVSLFLYLPQA